MLATLFELAPGKLSLTSLHEHIRHAHGAQQYVLDAATDKAREIASPLVLVDRVGSVGLFVNINDKQFWTAKIVRK